MRAGQVKAGRGQFNGRETELKASCRAHTPVNVQAAPPLLAARHSKGVHRVLAPPAGSTSMGRLSKSSFRTGALADSCCCCRQRAGRGGGGVSQPAKKKTARGGTPPRLWHAVLHCHFCMLPPVHPPQPSSGALRTWSSELRRVFFLRGAPGGSVRFGDTVPWFTGVLGSTLLQSSCRQAALAQKQGSTPAKGGMWAHMRPDSVAGAHPPARPRASFQPLTWSWAT